MGIHLVEGEAGCREAADRGAIAVVVDALRSGATLPLLFDLGAMDVYAVRELGEAHALRQLFPQALLAGELGGAKVAGFDLGNSPSELGGLAPGALTGRTIIFLSSAGSRRLVEVCEAPEVFVGSPVNARRLAIAVSLRAKATERDVVIVIAGPPDRVATPEDHWAACYLASIVWGDVAPEGRVLYDKYIADVLGKSLPDLYRQSPNAKRLAKAGFGEDVTLAAACNVCRSVPRAAGVVELPGGGRAVRLTADEQPDHWFWSRALV